MINKSPYSGFHKTLFLFFLCFFLYACQSGKTTNQETEEVSQIEEINYPDWQEIVLSKNMLDTLTFLKGIFLQEFSFRKLYGVDGNGELGYYPIGQLGKKELALIRRKIPGDTIFYLAAIKADKNPQIEKVIDIYTRMSSVDEQQGDELIYIRFSRPENPDPENDRIYIAICTETDSYYYDRNIEQYYFTENNGFTSFSQQAREYLEENQRKHTYQDFLAHGKPTCLFTTDNLNELEYVDINGLFNHFHPVYYRCDNSKDIAFHILPKFYRNHDLVIERIRTDEEEKFFLRKINNEAPQFEADPVMELTPYRKELNKEIKTYVECYEGNILLVFTEETERGLTTKSTHEVLPFVDPDLKGKYVKKQGMHMWLAHDKDFYNDKEEQQMVRDFLSYYCENYSYFKDLQLVDTISRRENTYTYKINEQGCKDFIHGLKKSGYVTDSFLQRIENDFLFLDEYYRELPHLSSPPGMAVDYIFLSLEPDNIKKFIEKGHHSTLFVRPIHETRSMVAIHLGSHGIVYDVQNFHGKWKINNYEAHIPFDKFYANGSRVALMLPKNEKQVERYMLYMDIDEKESVHDEPLKEALYILERDQVPHVVLDDDYSTIVLPDNTEIEMNKLYLYDIILYSDEKHMIINNIEKRNGNLIDGITSMFFKNIGFDFSL